MANPRSVQVQLTPTDKVMWGGEEWDRVEVIEVSHYNQAYRLHVNIEMRRDSRMMFSVGTSGTSHLLQAAPRFNAKTLAQLAAGAMEHPALEAMRARVREMQGVK